ncbi:hypothetical protein N9E51_00090 [Alphaproteobacteria bacterium]|nr:hypothetical protein [Alphaproteobacteria bacterium]
MSVYLIIKSETSLVNKQDFDNWYRNEHLKEAKKDFEAISAKRGWVTNTDYHLAIYEFENINMAKKILKSKKLKLLIKKFDNKWSNKVKRTRELVDIKQEI